MTFSSLGSGLVTGSDGYKFSMAEAGAALRVESFYYSHRRGGVNGWHYMPVDPNTFIQSLLPTPKAEDYEYLSQHSYEVGASFRRAFEQRDKLKIVGVPKGSWFYDREPAILVEDYSAVTSWLEPSALQLHFRIQIATAAKTGKLDERCRFATCLRERDIITETFDSIGMKAPQIEVRADEYYRSVLDRARDLVGIVKDPNRIFEVGMRAVSCMEQHEIALAAIKEAGILRTSNVFLAQKLGMIPVGTMGHEHPQRIGDDYEAFIAMRDRFPGFLFYLPDTFSTIQSGIPSALHVIAEQPDRDSGIRFDSEHGIRGHYMFTIAKAMEMGLQPRLALESGWNRELTVEFEELREMVKWPADRQAYGYGGYLVKPDWPSCLRDEVSAVYKLSKTGSRAVMKFGDEPGSAKASIPGRPVIWRPKPVQMTANTPAGYIAQEGEDWDPPVESTLISGRTEHQGLAPHQSKVRPPVVSPATQELIRKCETNRNEAIARAALRG
jgi:nicotinate phosphoribosyltransferase